MGYLSRFKIGPLKREGDLNSFVETGTGTGEGLYHASCFNFKKLYSIDIDNKAIQMVKNIFTNDKRIQLYCKSSVEALPDICGRVEHKTLFWLDAHFPHSITNKKIDFSKIDDYTLPLRKEIEIIKKFKDISSDYFIIDDLRIYEKGPYEKGDIPIDIHQELGSILSLFNDTHACYKDFHDEGYLICVPKNNKKFSLIKFVKKTPSPISKIEKMRNLTFFEAVQYVIKKTTNIS